MHVERHCLCGSSPLTRGKLNVVGVSGHHLGLIPAHAGKTRPARADARLQEAHPRSRGENGQRGNRLGDGVGSSPLTRGKPEEGDGRAGADGLIPAHAGKTHSTALPAPRRGAHPRSRGENLMRNTSMFSLPGSSPLTRGKLPTRVRDVSDFGLIPAHAGKTVRPAQVAGPLAGSSPLTRGKPSLHGSAALRFGLIPAHAGKTTSRSRRYGTSRAHPRSRGENATVASVVTAVLGSSPLTRGKHFLTCAFIAQIDQILESLELCASSGSYSLMDAYATDAPQDRVRSIGLAPLSSRGAS